MSYLSDGRQVVWEPREPPGDALAVDAELLSQPVPPALEIRFAPVSNEAFFVAWTRAECAAKLRATPLLVWLRDHGLRGDPHLHMRTFVGRDLVVTIAWRERLDPLPKARCRSAGSAQNMAWKNGLKPTLPGSNVCART